MNPAFLNMQSYWVCFYSLSEFLLNEYIHYVWMLKTSWRQHKNIVIVTGSNVLATFRVQKDQPTAYILSSIRSPLPSEAVAALRTASMMSLHLFTL